MVVLEHKAQKLSFGELARTEILSTWESRLAREATTAVRDSCLKVGAFLNETRAICAKVKYARNPKGDCQQAGTASRHH